MVATLRSPRNLFLDAPMGESYAALKASIICQGLGLQKVNIEGDALSVVNDINCPTEK